mgnify:CR=1 FL=1
MGILTATPSQALDVAGVANATTLSIGGTQIASTADELNLLDASTTVSTAASWGALERVGVFDITGSLAGATGTTIVLGTLPSGSVITQAMLDITTIFTPANAAASEINIGIGTSTTFPIVGGSPSAMLDFAPINALTNTGTAFNANTTLGVLNLSGFGFGQGFDLANTLKKLPNQENVEIIVADLGAGNDGGIASCGAKLYIKYIVM